MAINTPDRPRRQQPPSDGDSTERPRRQRPPENEALAGLPGAGAVGDPFGGPTDDDSFSVDLTNVKESMGAFNVPAGVYPGKCTDVIKEVSKAGNPMWRFMFTIKSGQQGGKKLPIFCALTEKAMWKVLEVLTAMDLGSAGQVSKFKKSDAVGQDVWMVVEEEQDDQGRYRGVLSRIVNPRDYEEEMPVGDAPDDPDNLDSIPF